MLLHSCQWALGNPLYLCSAMDFRCGQVNFCPGLTIGEFCIHVHSSYVDQE